MIESVAGFISAAPDALDDAGADQQLCACRRGRRAATRA